MRSFLGLFSLFTLSALGNRGSNFSFTGNIMETVGFLILYSVILAIVVFCILGISSALKDSESTPKDSGWKWRGTATGDSSFGHDDVVINPAYHHLSCNTSYKDIFEDD